MRYIVSALAATTLALAGALTWSLWPEPAAVVDAPVTCPLPAESQVKFEVGEMGVFIVSGFHVYLGQHADEETAWECLIRDIQEYREQAR